MQLCGLLTTNCDRLQMSEVSRSVALSILQVPQVYVWVVEGYMQKGTDSVRFDL